MNFTKALSTALAIHGDNYPASTVTNIRGIVASVAGGYIVTLDATHFSVPLAYTVYACGGYNVADVLRFGQLRLRA